MTTALSEQVQNVFTFLLGNLEVSVSMGGDCHQNGMIRFSQCSPFTKTFCVTLYKVDQTCCPDVHCVLIFVMPLFNEYCFLLLFT